MTGNELIKWIQDNDAGDKLVCMWRPNYDGDIDDIDENDLEVKTLEKKMFIDSRLQGKDVILIG